MAFNARTFVAGRLARIVGQGMGRVQSALEAAPVLGFGSLRLRQLKQVYSGYIGNVLYRRHR